ncbi:MAG TPA: BamA/TamA family outer membrane protein [Steroidobacteraceae bacterium]|nr:BamA/TamA family outer membrane protein [Steroidobacteraceae bacterium]
MATFLACGVLGAHAAHAANPQSYKVDWVASGDKAIDATMKLTSQLETLRRTAPVDPFGLIARARGDVTRLQTVLQSFGYYDGAITITIDGMGLDNGALADALAALPKKSDAHVKVAPTLGPLFHIGRIDVRGALPSGMREKMHLAPGAPAVASDVLAAGGNLQAALQDAGYAFATVEKPVAYEVPARHVLNLTFQVTTGPRVSIGSIGIRGLKDVHESLLRRRLLVHTGEQYDAAAIEKAREDLLSLGLFSTVSVKLGGADEERRVPITFVVQEAKKYAVGVSAAYSSDLGGSLGVNWSDHNVFGNGQELTASATAINLGGSATTGLGYDASVGYIIPDFRRPDQTLGFQIRGLRQALQAYTQTGEMAGTTLTRKVSSALSLTTGLSYEHEIIDQESLITCPPLQPGMTIVPVSQCQRVSYKYNLVLLPVSAYYDSTDLSSPLVDPTHGYRISLIVTPTYSYGSSSGTYVVVQGSLATYFDLNNLFAGDPRGRSVIAARVLSGKALGATQFSLPPDQRFYAGGSGTVRGYRYQSVGPEFADGNPEGGTNMEAFNLELRQRVGENLGFVVFADGGGVSSPSGSVYRVGVGAGMRYYTSIGPIRFDLALPTKKRANDDNFEIYIGLGQAF